MHTGPTCISETVTTNNVREKCQDKTACDLSTKSVNSIFTDPCPGTNKQLRVWYQCVTTPGNLYNRFSYRLIWYFLNEILTIYS